MGNTEINVRPNKTTVNKVQLNKEDYSKFTTQENRERVAKFIPSIQTVA